MMLKYRPRNREYIWTQQAIECYERGCNCDGCYIKEVLETRCVMKAAVIELVRRYGKPTHEKMINIKKKSKLPINFPDRETIIEGLKQGVSYDVMAKYYGFKIHTFQTTCKRVYNIDVSEYKQYRKRGSHSQMTLEQFKKWREKEC